MSDDRELYHRYRPRTLQEVIGQEAVVSQLETMVRRQTVPHTLLLLGPSGCGKTTIARILKTKLNCGDRDFVEMNCAESRGIDDMRAIQSHMGLAPMTGDCRIWLLDESHRLTGDAQSALLKTLEDTPRHVYFFLATTDPQKLLKTIITRCTEIKLQALSEANIERVVKGVVNKEKLTLTGDVVKRIVEVADGSARKALVLLHQVKDLKDDEEKLNAILSLDTDRQAIDLVKLLMNHSAKWAAVADLIKELKLGREELESFRHLVLSYANSTVLNRERGSDRAFRILELFRDHWYDCGKAGLTMACYDVVHGK